MDPRQLNNQPSPETPPLNAWQPVPQPQGPSAAQPSVPPVPPPPSQQPTIQKDATGQYAVVPPLQQTTQANTGHNPYEFIMNSNTPPSKTFVGGFSTAKKVLFGGLGLLLVVALVALAIQLLTPKDPLAPAMIAIAQEQQEIVRVASQNNTVTNESIKGFALNTQLSVGSDQQKIMEYLAKKKVKPNAKLLAAKRSTETDSMLASAKAANTYDTYLQKSLNAQLTDYMTNLQTTYKKIDGKNARELLAKSYEHARLLRQQSGVETAAAAP